MHRMPSPTFTQILALILSLALCCGLAACQSSGATKAKAPAQEKPAPAKATDPMKDLAARMFLLKDGRDMHLVTIRMAADGMDAQQVQEIARNLTMKDFESWLAATSGAKRLVYVGSGLFRMDVLDFTMGAEQFQQAQMFLKLKSFEVDGKRINAVILEQVMLEGRDFTPLASLRIYRGMIELAAMH